MAIGSRAFEVGHLVTRIRAFGVEHPAIRSRAFVVGQPTIQSAYRDCLGGYTGCMVAMTDA